MTPKFQQQSVSFFFTILNNTLVQKKHPIARGYPFVTRHRPPGGSHGSKWVTSHKMGHMSLTLWQIEPKSSCVPPYMGLNFPVPSFRTDILCHAQQSNITPKPLLCVVMKAFFCIDFLTFVCLPSSCSNPPPPCVAIPPRGRKRALAPGCHPCAHGIGPNSVHRSISLVLFRWSCSC